VTVRLFERNKEHSHLLYYNGISDLGAGVMLAARYWSLLSSILELSTKQELTPWTPVAIGFLFGGFFSKVMDNIIPPHLHSNLPPESVEGPKTKCKK
jgi:zinc transporter, ZIP family